MLGGGDEASQAEQAAAEARVTQTMIDVSASRLEGLRTQCATSAELTQQEIRTLEGKLMKLFSRQLVAKARFPRRLQAEFRSVPCLAQWLRVVGLPSDHVQAICTKMGSLEALKEASEHELRSLLSGARDEEVSRLIRAMFILKKYTDALQRGEGGGGEGGGDGPAMPLYWDSWDVRGSPRARARRQRASVPGEEALTPAPCLPHPAASTPPSPLTTSTPRRKGGATVSANKVSTTPLPARRNNNLDADQQPLTKSHSHDSKLTSHQHLALADESQSAAMDAECSPPPTPVCESPPEDNGRHKHNHSNTTASVSQSTSGSLSVPRSPHTPKPPGQMTHAIAHRFTRSFAMLATCDHCDKQMVLGSGLKCKECKFKCHRECESKVPPSCGLPHEFFSAFKETLVKERGSNLPNLPYPALANNASARQSGGSPAHGLFSLTRHKRARHPPEPGGPDSSSPSSCNSSTPSSPALVGTVVAGPNTPRTPNLHPKQQFHFPEVKATPTGGGSVGASPARLANAIASANANECREDVTASVRSGESSRPASLSGSTSTDSDRAARADSLEEGAATGNSDARWPRQNSLSMKEWDIPYDELRLFEVLGTGRFGTVYRGSWHGAVAVKLLNVQYLHDDGGALENFKHEVAIFRKTRHENLVLFMGACMKPPKLAIVTSLCKGMTLHTHIHLHRDKFNANKSAMVAQQIAQGMGYLHARGIVHKDLKSKNIFLENGKVVITDFGLFSVTKLCFWNNARGDSLGIPAGWLCYLAPELVRALRPHASVHLPFSKASDVYAFGTVWYELLCGEWPFKGQPPEAVIWQVGKGIKQTLSSLQSSRDVKDILMLCWAYRASERPDFARLLSTLEKLPRKRLARSPSHPVHLSRSAESVF